MREGVYSMMMTKQALRLSGVVLTFLLSLALHACSGSQPNSNSSPQAPSSPGAYEGFLDVVNCDAIIAWGWDSNRPDEAIKLDVCDGSSLIATIAAEHFRQDLLNAHKGNGKNYVFGLMSVQAKNVNPHTIPFK